ncbi:Bug family tripartite tricarboxylate transporter substrate binding protein [Rhodoplanes sp. Z2-YC6860]|uniref:Bug family tripartite tricarboxylate transporter substrate binding protein n=1 Tax=Rhodoplanes sp. Z2-YC6860 TaxID=674703 RepID=UPI00078D9F25|nr:tripartite tricarboxylate transporter substrate binding protein [Rhodoplanes sp. Z2-YC6860]AMN43240.1 ABC transporter substrate-binding protein [Rhodoplanes sp. Z2-YC6860]
MRMKTSIALALTLLLGFASAATAADDDAWPTHPVRLIAASGPGGNPDVMGRLLADKFSQAFGKPFIVENVPGAGGIVAANLVAKTQPDGYTLMFSDSGALAINPVLNPNLGYDPIKDFAPITALVTLPTILSTPPDLAAKTLDEFIALAKKQPGKMSFGSAGAGSIHHLTFAIFAERTGIDLLHVPYRGGSAMVNGLLTGEIQAGWSGIPNVIELIASGKLRGLCVSTLQRSPSTPQIATCDELGIKGFNVATMMGLVAPAGTSPKIVARIQAEAAKAMREPAMATRMTQLGMVMEEKGTENYAAFLKEDLARYDQAVKKLNLQTAK